MKMKTLGVVAISLCLVFSSTPTNAAAPITGSKCTKVGATASSGGKKYTCVKSGKKLVWDKGVVIPVVTKAPEVEVKSLLSSDPRITPLSALTSLEICKTVDKTPDYGQTVLLCIRMVFLDPLGQCQVKNQPRY